MEEVYKFLRLLKKHRLTLVIVPALTVIITFFLVRNLPDSYVSQSQIATGIVDNTQQAVLTGNSSSKGWAEVNQEFGNLIEMMKLKKILDQVSYKLIIHDLNSTKPFRDPQSALKGSSPAETRQILATFQEKYHKSEGLNLWAKDQSKLHNVLRALDYDSESLKGKLRIGRAGDSDFINAEFNSENPQLSAFVVNTLIEEFIKHYAYLVKTNQRRANVFLDSLLAEKRAQMNSRIAALRNYKIQNRVLNLEEQSSQLYAQILDYNNKKQAILKDVSANAGAVNEIEAKFAPGERGYLESTLTKINQSLVSTKEELKALYDLYIQNEFDPTYKTSIDSLQRILNYQINTSSDQYVNSPLATKQALIQQKILLEVQLDLSRYSMTTIDRELRNLNNQFDQMVPHEAEVQSLEREVEIASTEYLDALNKFNQSNMESGFSIKLNQVQKAMPGLPQPSKKMLLVILSGIITFVFCLMVLFILFFMDHSVTTAKELANKTNVPVLGSLNKISGPMVDLGAIWSGSASQSLDTFKNQLRSIRFEVDHELNTGIVAVTSMGASEGKTLLALSLAHAWKMTDKKILLIDGNFDHPDISKSLESNIYIEDYLTGITDISHLRPSSAVTVLANKGQDRSPLEIADAETIREKLAQLSELFDIIIIETPPVSMMNQSKEWILFAGNVIAVFEAGQTITDEKKIYIQYLKSLEGGFSGWVLNKYEPLHIDGKAKKNQV
ncbi:GumC family protein [Arcticibacter sp.]|uniref:GumC family protein n=1 Tax=Arcticibacter sp. TaxID=1872630 RepID=UPI003890B578